MCRHKVLRELVVVNPNILHLHTHRYVCKRDKSFLGFEWLWLKKLRPQISDFNFRISFRTELLWLLYMALNKVVFV